ncbi:MdtA/MuxA family multidrug efflux RND transporter periplasmic adaptor subunit [Astrobacterium formosum]|uniref:MdtA/MuxA family multidrug efflux RND transporter periplasmic adaptor subunit n=1 Tax=Astrobacterium formosum TaxID=3069710 RepID=UPI003F4F9AC4
MGMRGGGGPGGSGGRFRSDLPVPVLASPAATADVPVYLDGVGTTRALNTVTVKPQVEGKLIEILFREGQDVARGDVLAKIDPVTFQATLDQALAKKAQDEAQLDNARRDLERFTRLAETNSISKQQADAQRASVAQLEAQVRSDQASIDNARAILGYTTITAPISGRTGLRQVDVGNIVRASDTTGLVVITQIRPISVLFTLPQQQLAQVNTAMAKGPLAVEALGGDNRTIIERGTLQVIDNQVDQTTGTIKLKAEFPNPDLKLWPGQFVNVRLLVDTLKNAVTVPTAAVQRGPNGTFVYRVNDGDTVSVRPVRVALQDDIRAVVAEGVTPGERVVTTGFAQLTDGSRVSVSGGDTPAAAPPPGPNERPRRGPMAGQGGQGQGGPGKAGQGQAGQRQAGQGQAGQGQAGQGQASGRRERAGGGEGRARADDGKAPGGPTERRSETQGGGRSNP